MSKTIPNSTSARTVLAINNIADSVIDANPKRLLLSIFNPASSGVDLYISFIAAPTVDLNRGILEPGGNYKTNYQGDIFIRSNSAIAEDIPYEDSI